MTADSHNPLQTMTTVEILRRSIALYQENFVKLVGVIALNSVVWLIVLQFTFIGGDDTIQSSPGKGLMGLRFLFMGFMALFLALMIFFSLVTTAAGTIVISEGLLNRNLTIGQAYQRVVDLLFPLLGSLFLTSITIAIGLMLWGIPGLIAYVWFCLTPPIVMIEGEGGAGALKRSRTLVKEYFGKTFLVVPILAILQIVVVLILLSLPELLGNIFVLYALSIFLSIVLPLLIEPLKICTTTLLYFDLRIRKEGYNLQLMAEEISE